MKNISVLMLVCVVFLTLQGCETAEGFKKDVAYLFSADEPDKEYKENLIYKLDNWIKENMW